MKKIKLVLLTMAGANKKFYKQFLEKAKKEYSSIDIIETQGDTLVKMIFNLRVQLDNIKEDFVLLGHCIGGLTAINLWGEGYHNSYIKGLVLINSHYDYSHLTQNNLIIEKEDYNCYKQILPCINENFENGINKHVQTIQMKACVSKGYLEDKFNKINNKLPIMVLCSTNDEYFKEEMFIDLYKRRLTYNPLSTFYYPVINAKHLGIITHSEEYFNAVNKFVLSVFINSNIQEI